MSQTVPTATDPTKSLRDALGSFATGVTVITTVTPEGQRIGLTANSFTSVSLDPPLVLWSLKKNSANLDVFRRATHFAINVLSREQKDLCFRFASKVEGDRFDGVPLEPSRFDLPLLAHSLARFECARHQEVEAGDHVMFLGRVEEFRKGQGEALIFSGGRILEPGPAAACA
jgi:flavin reductase (DIM6/NTAB) family NADH-FMN oxidoreductase RutF